MSRIAHIPVRWSWLKCFAQSPAHALHSATHGKEPTAAMKMGTFAHAAAFEPGRLVLFEAGTYVDDRGKTPKIVPHTDRRTGKGFELFKKRQRPDAVIMNAREMDRAVAIANALRAADEERVHPVTGEALPLLFGPGVLREQRILWSRNGRACSSTPDARLPGKWITDLKVARTGDPDRYPRDATRQGYPSQLVMYDEADAHERTGDHRDVSCELFSVVVEPFAPHVVTTYMLKASAVASGARMLEQWWERLASCETSDYWPGYVQSVADYEVDDPMAILDGLGLEPDDEADAVSDDVEPDGDEIDWNAA